VGQTVCVTTNQDRAWGNGEYIILTLPADTSNFLVGCVTSYSGTSLCFEVKYRSGTQAAALWNINPSAVPGPSGPPGATGPIGIAGPTGPVGAASPPSSRGATNAVISLAGGTTILDCGATELFRCDLTSTSTLKLNNAGSGQVIYILVSYANVMADLSWSNPSDGSIYWENDTIPYSPSFTGYSKLYQFIKIYHATSNSIYLAKDLGEFNI